MHMSGTPTWEPIDCVGPNGTALPDNARKPEDLSEDEKLLAAGSYKVTSSRANHLLTMPFLRTADGKSLSEYYSNAGMFGLVGSVLCIEAIFA